MKKRTTSPILLTVLTAMALTAAGCSDSGKEAKDQLQSALAKQGEMKAYTFTGTADLNIDTAPPAAGANPLTGALLGLFLKGKLEWNGATSVEPIRLEARIKSTPAGSSAPIELPVLLQDNKMYLHIPMLNKEDEFYSVDLAELAKNSQGAQPLQPESLKNTGKGLSDAARIATSDWNAKWFKAEKNLKLADGTSVTAYRVDVTEKNASELNEALKAKWPQLADSLKSAGLMTQSMADSFKSDSSSTTLKAPGTLSVKVDSAGMLREETIKLTLERKGKDGQVRPASFVITQSYNGINQAPAFTMELPKATRPLSDLLKLVPAPTQAK